MPNVVSPVVSPRPGLSEAIERDCHVVVGLVSQSTGIARDAFFAPSRLRRAASDARQTAMYLCHVVLELNLTQVGLFFGRDRTTVAHACGRIEDSRDDLSADAFIEGLEEQILDMCRDRLGMASEPCVSGRVQHAAF